MFGLAGSRLWGPGRHRQGRGGRCGHDLAWVGRRTRHNSETEHCVFSACGGQFPTLYHLSVFQGPDDFTLFLPRSTRQDRELPPKLLYNFSS